MKTIAEYIRRMGKSRGFGIQSPWAYTFVTEVIGERNPYYAYADIDKRYPRNQRKRQRLYHRIQNFAYPHRTYITNIAHSEDILRQLCRMAAPHGIVIIEDIHRDKTSREQWLALRDSEIVGITFDLYDFAICFMDRQIHKQHYKLNF